MTTEQYPASIVEQLPITEQVKLPQGYFRSKLFTAPLSTNPLVAAAGPILSLMERLCITASVPSIDSIRGNIEHELYAFHSKLNASKYPEELINIAYYFLTTSIDEILAKNYLRLNQEAPEFQAFTPVTTDGKEPQTRFFEMIAYLKEKPNQYLDLIELAYFCLIAGFEGIYHQRADGRQALDNLIEELFQLIQQYRCHKPHKPFNENPLPQMNKKDYKPLVLTAMITLGILGFAFITSQSLLESKAKSVMNSHTQLALLDN